MDEALGSRHRSDDADLGTATGLTHDRHVARITAKVGDVVVDPFQGCDQVEDTDIAGMGVFLTADLGEIGEAERIQTVVDGADDHVAIGGKAFTAVTVLLDGAAVEEAAAMEVDEHRTFLRIQTRGPDIQPEAVFAGIEEVPVVDETGGGLRAPVVGNGLRSHVAVIEGETHPIPRLRFLRRHEAVLSGGAGTVRNTLELIQVVVDIPPDLTVLGIGHGDVLTDEQLLRVGVLRRLFSGAARQ